MTVKSKAQTGAAIDANLSELMMGSGAACNARCKLPSDQLPQISAS